jgi:hypothetical protein
MKAIPTFLIAAILALNACGQSVPNGSFENWTATLGIDMPDGWLSSSYTTEGYPNYGVLKTTDAVDGNYAVKLVSGHVNEPAYGFDDTTAWLGTAAMAGMVPVFGFAFSQRPQAFRFSYKYVPQSPVGQDTARIYMRLTKLNQTSKQRDIVGDAELKLASAVSTYTSAQIPITYYLPDTPDTANIDITSSLSGMSQGVEQHPGKALLGNTLYVDKLDFGSLVSVNTRKEPNRPYTMGLIQRSGKLAITGLPDENSSYAILDPAGRAVMSGHLRGGTATIDASLLPEGMYFLRIGNYRIQCTEKVMICR